MKRFNRMLKRLELSQKEQEPETLFKHLWTVSGGWSNTTRGMLLAMLPSERAAEIKASHVSEKKE